MAKGDMQINRLLGEATLALHQGRNPAWLPELPWMKGGSPNHKGEAASVALRAHMPPDPLAAQALKQALRFLDYQEEVGHGCAARACELLTDSHAPIWYRLMASMLDTAYSLRTRKDYRSLYARTLRWWAHECYLCNLLTVPSGPLAGQVVGVAARYAAGNNTTRNVCQQMIRARAATSHPSRASLETASGKTAKWWGNTLVYQDTFAAALVRDLVVAGAFAELQPSQPTLSVDLTVEHCEQGHFSRVPQPLQGDDPTVVWVRYDSGEIGTGEPPELGHQLDVRKMEARLPA